MPDQPSDVHANVIVPCRDTREDLDGALCTGEFRYGPRDIQAKCTVCGGWRGRYAPGLAADIAEDAYQRGLADAAQRVVAYALGDELRPVDKWLEAALDVARQEGRCQATEGWEREWGVRDRDGYVFREPSEAEARTLITEVADMDPGCTLASRLVGPWETAEQPEEESRG